MSPEEFAAWRVFDTLSPIGGERADRHAALVASVLANVNRSSKQDAFTLDDFDLYKPPRTLTRAEEEERFRRAFEARGLVVRG